MAFSEPDKEQSLCTLMARLKVGNPNLGRKEMHSAVVAEGPEWKEITVEEISNLWRRMKRKNARNKENIVASSKQNLDYSVESPSLQELGACEKQGSPPKLDKANSIKAKKSPHGRREEPQEYKEINASEITAAFNREKVLKADSNKSPALEKHLKYLAEYPGVNYVVFTPSHENKDYAIKLADAMGEVFFNVMWNRVVRAPFGSKSIKRELWMIYDQLHANLLPRYRKMLRNQLQEEFGVDPLEGK
ncbi:uncharacterized protein [Palaemon carinicauda]|uniref:uncharacterized protein n=1 Tax=Palaemon carinicauda TaxID=392227 RepID=UPI0035B60B7B